MCHLPGAGGKQKRAGGLVRRRGQVGIPQAGRPLLEFTPSRVYVTIVATGGGRQESTLFHRGAQAHFARRHQVCANACCSKVCGIFS